MDLNCVYYVSNCEIMEFFRLISASRLHQSRYAGWTNHELSFSISSGTQVQSPSLSGSAMKKADQMGQCWFYSQLLSKLRTFWFILQSLHYWPSRLSFTGTSLFPHYFYAVFVWLFAAHPGCSCFALVFWLVLSL